MQWFKHSTGSHDDPCISDAWDELGDFGYVGFFVILELYGQEYKHRDKDGFIELSETFLRRKLRKSSTKVQLLLNFFEKRNRIISNKSNGRIWLKIPKFIDLASNWTKRIPTEAPTEAPHAKEVEVEEDNTPPTPPQGGSAEPEKKLAPAPAITLPLNDGTEYSIYETVIQEMSELYPAIDVLQEFRKMRAWCLANTENRKTKSGIKRFYNRWLSKAHDQAGKLPPTRPKRFENERPRSEYENRVPDMIIDNTKGLPE